MLCVLQCGILPYAGVDICLFELLKDKLLEQYDGDPPHAAIVGGGMVSSSIAQFVSYPLALVRTRLQVGGGLSHRGGARVLQPCARAGDRGQRRAWSMAWGSSDGHDTIDK